MRVDLEDSQEHKLNERNSISMCTEIIPGYSELLFLCGFAKPAGGECIIYSIETASLSANC